MYLDCQNLMEWISPYTYLTSSNLIFASLYLWTIYHHAIYENYFAKYNVDITLNISLVHLAVMNFISFLLFLCFIFKMLLYVWCLFSLELNVGLCDWQRMHVWCLFARTFIYANVGWIVYYYYYYYLYINNKSKLHNV